MLVESECSVRMTKILQYLACKILRFKQTCQHSHRSLSILECPWISSSSWHANTTIYCDTTAKTLHTMHLQRHKQTKTLTDGQTGRYKQSSLTGKSTIRPQSKGEQHWCTMPDRKASVVRMRHKQWQLFAVPVCVCRVSCHNTLGNDGNSLATLLRIWSFCFSRSITLGAMKRVLLQQRQYYGLDVCIHFYPLCPQNSFISCTRTSSAQTWLSHIPHHHRLAMKVHCMLAHVWHTIILPAEHSGTCAHLMSIHCTKDAQGSVR